MAKPKLRGEAFLVRYADDFVIVCAMKSDADKLLAILPNRFGRYGLTLHPEKTRLVRFTKPAFTSSHKGGGNGRARHSFYEAVRREWQRWLNRRSQRNNMTWERFEQMLRQYVLPRPSIVHAHAALRSLDLRSRMR